MAGTSGAIKWKSLPWASLSLLNPQDLSHFSSSQLKFCYHPNPKSSKCPKQNYETTALKSKSLLMKSPSSNKMAFTKPLQSHHLSWKWKSSLKALLCPLDALCLPLAMISPGLSQTLFECFCFLKDAGLSANSWVFYGFISTCNCKRSIM